MPFVTIEANTYYERCFATIAIKIKGRAIWKGSKAMVISVSTERQQALSQAIDYMDMARQELCKIKVKRWEWAINDVYVLLDDARFIIDNIDQE